MNQSMK